MLAALKIGRGRDCGYGDFTLKVEIAAMLVFVAIEAWGIFLPLTYDEPWYLDTVASVDLHGFATRQFFATFPGPTGPLHAWVHWILRPVTQLVPPFVRLVNPALVVVTMWLVAMSVRVSNGAAPWRSALLMTAIPMAWPCTGLALTEVPAMAFYAAHMFLLFFCWTSPPMGWRSIAAAVLSGIALGVAILGRQPLLLTLGAVIVCAVLNPRYLGSGALCVAATLAVCMPVFYIWQGLVPPSNPGDIASKSVANTVVAGVVPLFAIYGLAYAGITVAIVAPAVIAVKPKTWIICVVLFATACIVLQLGTRSPLPLETLVTSMVPTGKEWVVRCGATGAVLGLATVFFVAFSRTLLERRADPIVVFCIMALLSQVIAAAAVRHQFSSRYLFAVAPAILVLSSRFDSVRSSPVRAGVGAMLGMLSLISYLLIASQQG